MLVRNTRTVGTIGQKFFLRRKSGYLQTVRHSKLITTAIEYPNGLPHLGHAYEKIIADALARYQRLKGEKVRLTLGLDEHSHKVLDEAARKGKTPQDYCEHLEGYYRSTWNSLAVEPDFFVRTSSLQHKQLVQKAVEKSHEKGDVYFQKSQTHRCEKCPEAKREFEIKDGKCRTHGVPIVSREEEGYFFRTTRYKNRLRKLLEENSEFIFPQRYKADILNFLNVHLEDFFISRAGSWGVPFPIQNQGEQRENVVYVWYDALLNYLTASGYGFEGGSSNHFWPAHTQVIGRDITHFHGLLWPAILFSLDLPLPRRLLVHSFVNFGEQKVSKSAGHGKETIDDALIYGADALRYYLLRDFSFSKDKAFDPQRFAHVVSVELQGKVDFFLEKLVRVVRENENDASDQCAILPDPEFIKWLNAYHAAFERDDLNEALAALYQVFQVQTRLLHRLRDLNSEEVHRALRVIVEQERLKAIWAWPIVPGISEKILQSLGIYSSVLSGAPQVATVWQSDTVRLGHVNPGARLIA